MRKKIAIIGGGVSGCFLAHLMSMNQNFDITIFEKSRGLGGRCSHRKHNLYGSFSHGAQFITNQSERLANYFENLLDLKIIKKIGHEVGYSQAPREFSKASECIRYVGTPTMNAFVKFWAGSSSLKTETKIESAERINQVWRLTDQKGQVHTGYDICILSILVLRE